MAALELPGGTGGGQFQLNLPVRLPVRSLSYNPVVLGCAAHCSPFGRSLHRLTEGTQSTNRSPLLMSRERILTSVLSSRPATGWNSSSLANSSRHFLRPRRESLTR